MHIIEDDFTDFKYNLPFRFIDLMKMGGFQKSLKLIGVNLKWHKLQDLPLPLLQMKIWYYYMNTI
jgi:hypothetical protein